MWGCVRVRKLDTLGHTWTVSHTMDSSAPPEPKSKSTQKPVSPVPIKSDAELPVLRYVDLFCGLGAFHCAFAASPRFTCVLACDIDEGVRNIYKANYGIEPKGDIRSLDVAAMPDFDILCAGFPCQPFSIAGNGEGFHDTTKGNLFFDILRIIDGKGPQMCILENVKQLKTHDNGNTYKTIERELTTRGYHVVSKVINATDYGSPQARQRIFIVATRGDKPFNIPDGLDLDLASYVPVRSIIDFTATATSQKLTLDMDRYSLVPKPHKPNQNARGKPIIMYDVVSKTTNKGGRQGERVYSIDGAGITVCASSGGPGAKTGLYQIGDTVRRLTVKETLGMFGFPADYAFPGVSAEDALFYLGNSIVVNIVLAFVPSIESWFVAER